MSRLVLISNKQCDSKDLACATQALSPDGANEADRGLWLGWNGDVQNFGERPVCYRHNAGYEQVTFPLSVDEFCRHYQGYYHDGLWPVFHNQPEKAHFTPENYRAYRQLNLHFADIACEYVCPSDIICIDDYQLLPCGQALKEQGLLNPCAFFFHLPFPSAALLRQIPEHRGLIESLFFYDLIGFQTLDDRNNFLSYLANEYPLEMLPDDQLQVNGHIFATGLFPAGINARKIY
ncbi:trehalose-6-phosphate synthase [Serratia plymuthica]|jgi:trehalose 6-phosphate synthase|uniref:trehalose-6-phosphate synthase n=1 Tax=Serratia TaxID=613 RepID=UPI00020E9287|nr:MULTISPECIES: trehalose-6-phosphate synthase [Serratia]AEF43675.1 Alpha,alpha-trehalose-phosphate synthase (UDP-forming) [Serratia plymuthica AS9]AEF48627.1 Alpha,alpha-trehalose-phosphate synthase (UDP-forming) [Serratia sp. AS12]AEG26335.1 Alpha,alpha-trehalose-phosphate synthase (UDP-forming) [Serratia sp. AS13]AHY05501.1 glycosyl transferase [Serratia plymuthica]ANJ96898.1 glycosyl transferase [Serratia plymuthica]